MQNSSINVIYLLKMIRFCNVLSHPCHVKLGESLWQSRSFVVLPIAVESKKTMLISQPKPWQQAGYLPDENACKEQKRQKEVIPVLQRVLLYIRIPKHACVMLEFCYLQDSAFSVLQKSSSKLTHRKWISTYKKKSYSFFLFPHGKEPHRSVEKYQARKREIFSAELVLHKHVLKDKIKGETYIIVNLIPFSCAKMLSLCTWMSTPSIMVPVSVCFHCSSPIWPFCQDFFQEMFWYYFYFYFQILTLT